MSDKKHHLTKLTAILSILFVAIYASPQTAAKKAPHFAAVSSLSLVTNGTEKHFDVDKNGALDPYERLKLRTHLVLHYPLVTKQKQKPYDVDVDGMLEPHEMTQYLADKEAGLLNQMYKKYITGKKMVARKRRERLDKIAAKNARLRGR